MHVLFGFCFRGCNAHSNFSVPTPSLQFTDQQGLVCWSNVPDADLRFQVFADGLRVLNGQTNEARGEGFNFAGDFVTVHPDGQEHFITMQKALSEEKRAR
jgi:hypothetical protein